ncbi:MAG: nucleotide exchange factor GrpE [Phenylobacterium sp.]|uniref:nucleotide exchange factor GrpE n=1 Tax=Phenylobacterium sp. TaxID=1871053 RepID=UPI001A3FF4CD|nr:nucleotide exchange factor GrpE [Phenylobacterium sp.]MBL8773771.1 nucleotide exchange factor GrpE [Phenylobacterium sp.]
MSEDNTPVDGAPEEAGDADVPALLAEVQALKEQVLRYAAEAENTRRRAEREMNDARAYAITKFARDLLDVADNLSLAIASNPPDSGDSKLKSFIEGVELTEKKLLSAFEKNGLAKVSPGKGEKFDPHKHQAMMEQVDADVAAGSVIQTLQAGYELLGRLVRPAMVVVAAKGSGANAPKAEAAAAPAANPYDGGAGSDGEQGGSLDTRA